PAVERLCKAASVPVIVNPNAGLPKVVGGKTVFDVSASDFVKSMEKIASIPSRSSKILGGCCGTTPEYIKGIFGKSEGIVNMNKGIVSNLIGCVSSNSQIVYFGSSYPTVLIGERINPTGKKKFKEALRSKDIPYIIHQGIEQEEAGAQVLDVNVGLPEIDEKEMMLTVMEELQSVSTLPLQIDTTNTQVMEAALRRYNGKAMINSVNGKQEVMDAVFPLVKKYGGLVVALTLDEDGIPETSARRIEIARKIYAEAEKYGIAKKDIIIDPLAMAVSSDTKAGLATLETVRAVHQMGGLTSLGISNVSFGLPMREFVTASFFTMAMQNGLSASIMNPLQQEMKKAWHTTTLLLGKDENCAKYIEWTETVNREQLIGNSLGGGSLPLAPAGKPSSTTPTPKGEAPLKSPAEIQNGQGVLGGDPLGEGVADKTTNAAEISSNSENKQTGCVSPLSHAIIKGLKNDAASITRELLTNTDSLEIINEHLIPGLDYVGKRFEAKTMYLPQLLMAAEAAKSAFAEIRSFMERSGKKGEPKGKI
ncbi:MAG: dihydropteroate synthase, partial [Treponema sp.]|nr:dihydropteroate synthase [Treponema sp.]